MNTLHYEGDEVLQNRVYVNTGGKTREIKFNNRQELKKYLDYLEDVEIEDTLKNNHRYNNI